VLFDRDDSLRLWVSEIRVSGDHRCIELTPDRSDHCVGPVSVGTVRRYFVPSEAVIPVDRAASGRTVASSGGEPYRRSRTRGGDKTGGSGRYSR